MVVFCSKLDFRKLREWVQNRSVDEGHPRGLCPRGVTKLRLRRGPDPAGVWDACVGAPAFLGCGVATSLLVATPLLLALLVEEGVPLPAAE